MGDPSDPRFLPFALVVMRHLIYALVGGGST